MGWGRYGRWILGFCFFVVTGAKEYFRIASGVWGLGGQAESLQLMLFTAVLCLEGYLIQHIKIMLDEVVGTA